MIKRTFDVMLAAIGLVSSAPLWAVMAVAIKLEDGGLVFFPQDRVGRVLRTTAMDELPQLWNIFVGDMSFVGPRPLRPGEVEVRGDGRVIPLRDIPGYARRHGVRPGLTGLTQVYAPRDIPRASKFRLDLLYLKRASFCLDMKLIVLSFWITGRGEWEARGRKV